MADANVNNHTPVATGWAIAAWLIWFAQFPVLLVGVPRAMDIFNAHELILPTTTLWLVDFAAKPLHVSAWIDGRLGAHVGAIILIACGGSVLMLVVAAVGRSSSILAAMCWAGVILLLLELVVLIIPMARI